MNQRRRIAQKLDELGRRRTPFFFLIDFDLREHIIESLDRLPETISFSFPGLRHEHLSAIGKGTREPIRYRAVPPSYATYKKAFDRVYEALQRGDSYLLNLTFPTLFECDADLETLYTRSEAPFKLLLQNRFVCFSPERFVRIEGNTISTYPMKGTIDATLPDAQRRLMENPKEQAEHTMIVDLLRNDLGIVSEKVRVERFRYVERLHTARGDLLQSSSEIRGELPSDWRERLGEILTALLPAGSVTGTPKRKTVQIIRNVESYRRGFYTGIFGIFDGENLDSAVAIRFIERQNDGTLFYKSGGGITAESDPEAEYRELKEKIYVPFL